MNPAPVNRLKWVVRAIKLAIGLLVIWGIWKTVAGAQSDFQKQNLALADLGYGWLLASAGYYLLAQSLMGVYWWCVLRAMGERPPLLATLRAYFIGHLGKYVPGKALVVVLRAGLLKPYGVNATVAAVSVFVETLTMMAVGAFLAAAIIAVQFSQHWQLLVLAIGMMLAAGVPTCPPLFRRIVRLLKVKRLNAEIDQALAGVNWRLMFVGWVADGIAWLLMGMSLWATLLALPDIDGDLPNLVITFPLVVAAVCLAVVAGFLSLIPGGLGVRELVLDALMAPRIGKVAAILSAVLLRVVWLLAELAISLPMWLLIRPKMKPTNCFPVPRD